MVVMLSEFFGAPVRIHAGSRLSGALLGSFANHLFESGYAKISAWRHIRSEGHIIHFDHATEVEVGTLPRQ
jgi:hypothetical protein